MGSFNRDRGGFQPRGRSSFGGGGRGFDRGDRGDRPMYKAICSNCGKECEVPFRPTNGKPVYCSDCFEKMGGRRSDSPRPERSDFRTPGAGPSSAQFDALNAKMDRIINLLEPKKKVSESEKKLPKPKEESGPVVSTPVVLTPAVEKVIDEATAPKDEETPKVKKVTKKKTSVKK